MDSEEFDIYDVMVSVKTYFEHLVKTGKIQIIGEQKHSFEGAEAFPGIRYSLTDKFVEYVIVDTGEKSSVYIPDGDTLESDDYGIVEKMFSKKRREMINSNDYYVTGTDIVKGSIKKGKKSVKYFDGKYYIVDRDHICRELGENNSNNEAIMNFAFASKDGAVIVLDDGTCEDIDEDKFLSGELDCCGYTDKKLFYKNSEIEIKEERNDKIEKPVAMAKRCSCESYEVTKYKISPVYAMCYGKNKIKLISASIYKDNAEVYDIEMEEEITSITAQFNCIIVNNKYVICGFEYKKDISPVVRKICNIDHFENELKKEEERVEEYDRCHQGGSRGFANISENDFVTGDKGSFYTKGLNEEELLKLYIENGFDEQCEKLKEQIAKREKERQAEAQKKDEEYARLSRYVASAQSLLVPVVYYDPINPDRYSDSDEMDGAKILDASTNKEIDKHETYYYSDNSSVQSLYGMREKSGWRRPAYRGMIINVDMAKTETHDGKLHIDVPEEAMGTVIGKGGINIKKVTSMLRKKGVDVSRIILHPKNREEMKIALDSIAEAIGKQRTKSHG